MSIKDINWGKAPSGATHYNAECACPWLKETPPSFFDDGDWIEYGSHAYEGHFSSAIKRPQVMTIKEWDGTGGVPPIGTACEYFCSERDKWRMCEIVAYYFADVVAVDVLGRTAVFLPSDLFRPLRTPEQIAAEEKSKAVDEMLDSAGLWISLKDVMETLYDRGYRKTEVNND